MRNAFALALVWITGRQSSPAVLFLLLIASGCQEAGVPPAVVAEEAPQSYSETIHDERLDDGRLDDRPLYDAWPFHVGVAVQARQFADSSKRAEAHLIQRHFDTVVGEYEMKADKIAPAPNIYHWDDVDAIVDWASARGQRVRGHTLVWHQSTPEWFFDDASAEQLRDRLERYVADVVGRYRGRIFAWDVVNEPIDDGDETFRRSRWFEIAGSDYIEWAFRAARKADPDALLFLNDYRTEDPDKLTKILSVVKDLQTRGVPIDGVGHQFHLNISQSMDTIESALDRVAQMGLVNHITELDVSLYADPGSCFEDAHVDCAPQLDDADLPAMLETQAELYRSVFVAASERRRVEAVMLWGLHDGQSWLNSFPVRRQNHPLLFDRQLEQKPAMRALFSAL